MTIVSQLAVVYLPFLQRVFHTTALPARDLALSLLLSSTVAVVVEVVKWLGHRGGGRTSG